MTRYVGLDTIGEDVTAAKAAGNARILMAGGHAVKLGLSQYVVDLIERGFISHVATNGSMAIHDFELSSFGETRRTSRSGSSEASSACGKRRPG